MTHILALHSSLSSEHSISSRLINQTVAALRQSAPNAEVTVRDLAASPVPHLDGEALSGIRGDAVTEAQIAGRALANKLFSELKAADVLVIGAPMYNFGIPSSLKAWFDYVLHPGVTFQYGEGAPKALLTGKRAIVILSRGGFYSDGPAKAYDSQEPHLRALLGFIGITDVTFIYAERLAMGLQVQEAALATATGEIERAVEACNAAA
jgi:FMN-dependent NADH-azoreductase